VPVDIQERDAQAPDAQELGPHLPPLTLEMVYNMIMKTRAEMQQNLAGMQLEYP